MSDTEDPTSKMSDTEIQSNYNNNNNDDQKMSDINDSDKFAEEIIETGVVRKTVKRSYIIQEVSRYTF